MKPINQILDSIKKIEPNIIKTRIVNNEVTRTECNKKKRKKMYQKQG